MPHLSIRIDFEPSGSALGPGMAELLERIDKMGTIQKATDSMGMSYRKAWLLVKGLQDTFGQPVVSRQVGGSNGGGSRLTEFGRRLLQTFRDIERKAEYATVSDVAALSALVQNDAPPRRKATAKRRMTS